MLEISQLLKICVERNASDIHLTVNKPPTLRIDGGLVMLDYGRLSSQDTERIMKSITTDECQRRIQNMGGADFAFSFADIARFRVSVYRQKVFFGLALRLIPSKLMTLEEIGLPEIVKNILSKRRGLILVTGPTGSGKTTTLAAMVDFINSNKDRHIITIEDPIEYFHEHKKGIITQRELIADVASFSEAIVRGLRSNPDVIMVGEMRDLATIEAAVLAAETGHLVLATLHTTSAANTIDRIIDVFPPFQQDQIRVQLSSSILAIFAQQLLVRVEGVGRIAAFEVMVATASIKNLIREKKTFRIPSVIQTGAKYGMKTFDSSLVELHKKGLINAEIALEQAFDDEQLKIELENKENI